RVPFHVVKPLYADPEVEPGSPRHDYDILAASLQIAADRHARPSGKRCPRVTGAVAIVFAFRPQEKTIEPAVLSHRGKAIEPPGKHFVHITLMAHVHDKSVPRRVEHAMQGDSQFDHAKIRSKMSASLRK